MAIEHASNNGLVINSTAGSPTLYLRNVADSNLAKLLFTDNGLTFDTANGGTRMTLNSTGLGVGVSPNDKLTVLADNYLSFQTSTLTFNSGRVGRIGAVSSGSGNGYLVFETYKGGSGGGERMRIDSDGNVGIGVTPSANRLQVAGNIGLPNSCTATGETSGVFSIDVANLLALTGSNWRQASILIVYSGIDGGATNPTVLQTVVTLTGLSTWNTIAKNDIVGTASVAVSSSTATGATITFTVPTGNSGSVYAMLLGGAGATTRPSMTINA